MRNLWALTRREIGSLFLTPSLHVVTAVFVLIYSLYFCFSQEKASTFEPLALVVCFMSIFLVPLITMRSFAEEKNSGTLELLLTAPVGAGEVVLSKFIGCLVFYTATLLPCLVYIGLLAAFGNEERFLGDLDRGEVLASLLGLLLVGSLYIAIGLYMSSLTDSQVVAAAASCAAMWVLLIFAVFEEKGEGITAGFAYLSFVPHFKRFLPGIIDSRDLVYFVSTTACVLILTWLVVRGRGMFARLAGVTRRHWELLGGVLAALALVSALVGVASLHIRGLGVDGFFRLWTEKRSTFVLHCIPIALAPLLLAGALLCLRVARQGARTGWLSFLRHSQAGPTLVGTLAILVIVGNVNFLAASSWIGMRSVPVLKILSVLGRRQWDITEGKANSLHEDTRRTLDELTDRVDFYVFYSADVNYQDVALLEETRKLLTRFSDYSPRMHVTYADAIKEPEKAQALAKDMNIPANALPHMTMVIYQGRRAALPDQLMLKMPEWKEQMIGIRTPKFNGELVITLGLKRLMDPRVTRIYFTQGHNEMSVSSTQAQPSMAGTLAQALRQDGFDVRTMLLKGQPVPLDCDVLVLLGPHIPMGPPVVKTIANYVDRGGRVLLLLPAVTSIMAGRASADADDPDLMALLKTWGCTPRRDLIIDQRHNHAGQPTHVHAMASENHPITNTSRGVVCVLPYARSLQLSTKVEDQGWLVHRLLVTSESSLAKRRVYTAPKTKPEWKTRQGPLTVAMAAARPGNAVRPESRVVVVGDAEFLSNLSIDKGHNKPLAISALHWLAGRDYKIRVPAKEYVDRSLNLTGDQQRLLMWVSLAALPLAWLLVGWLVWWIRKQ